MGFACCEAGISARIIRGVRYRHRLQEVHRGAIKLSHPDEQHRPNICLNAGLKRIFELHVLQHFLHQP